MDTLIEFGAKYLILVPIVAIFYVLYELKDNKHRRQFLTLLIIGGVLSLLAAQVAEMLYDNPRPFIKDGIIPLFYATGENGFPSDHTLLASFLAFTVWQYRRNLGLALLIIAVLVGWARVAASVHHMVDVIASILITGAVSFGVGYFIHGLNNKKTTTNQRSKTVV